MAFSEILLPSKLAVEGDLDCDILIESDGKIVSDDDGELQNADIGYNLSSLRTRYDRPVGVLAMLRGKFIRFFTKKTSVCVFCCAVLGSLSSLVSSCWGGAARMMLT